MEIAVACLFSFVLGAVFTAAYKPDTHAIVDRSYELEPSPSPESPSENPIIRRLESLKDRAKKPLPMDEQLILYRDGDSGMTSMRTVKEVREKENERLQLIMKEEKDFADDYCDGLGPLGGASA